MQADAGDSFYSEIPFWVSQEFHKNFTSISLELAHDKVQYHKHLRFKAEGDFEYQAQP
jgi:hypothetical protein